MKRNFNDTTSKYRPTTIFENEQSIYCLLSQTDGNKEIFIEINDPTAIYLNYLLNKSLLKIKTFGLYDTLINSLEQSNVIINDLVIYDKKNETWFGQIEFYNKLTNEIFYEDIKPSELMCLSLKLKMPIYIYDSLVAKKEKKRTPKPSQKTNLDLLNQELSFYIEKENYEKALETKKKIQEIMSKEEGV